MDSGSAGQRARHRVGGLRRTAWIYHDNRRADELDRPETLACSAGGSCRNKAARRDVT